MIQMNEDNNNLEPGGIVNFLTSCVSVMLNTILCATLFMPPVPIDQ